jgi:hypothetical protein
MKSGLMEKIFCVSASVFLMMSCGGGGDGTEPNPGDGDDNTPPSVQLTSPTNGQTVSGVFTIAASATDDTSIDRVLFHINNALMYTASNQPYQYEWDTTSYADSMEITMYAEAFDSTGNSGRSTMITVTVDNQTVDNVAPASVSDLTVAQTFSRAVRLTWTAPGDDGNNGVAASYDVRYSTIPITISNWMNAIRCTGLPIPQPVGSSQSYLVQGLSADTSYYFALQSSDDAGNTSGLSNVARSSASPQLFSGRTDYSLCNYQVKDMNVIAADLNNDGFSDLVVSPVADYGGSWQIAVLINRGDGTFTAPSRYTADTFPDSLSTADINGDDSLDLVIACHRVSGSPDSIAVLINQGTGTFGSPTLFTYSTGRGSKHITTPDINNDGYPDVVVTNGGYYSDPDSSVSLFLNDGSGALSAEVNYPVGDDAWMTAVADVDGDGDKDFVTACYNQEMVWLMRNRGDSTFDLPTNLYSSTIGNHSTYVVSADFDGNGHVDIAATNDYPDTVVFLRNEGGGNFDQAVNYDVGEYPLAMAVVDYNLDGNPDILSLDHSREGGVGGGISLLLNHGDGTFEPFQTFSLEPDILTDFTAADFDGDGFHDIAVTFYDGTRVSVFFNSEKP